jgi:nitrite reductase (NADH) large subunit
VERVGIATLRQILVDDSLGICERLDAEIQKAVDAYQDPWKEADVPAYPEQFTGPVLAYPADEAGNHG